MIIIIDPWKTNYSKGFINALSQKSNKLIIFFTCKKNKDIISTRFLKVYHVFFNISDFLNDSLIRKFIRTLEYIFAYIYICFYILFNFKKVSVIHIQWLLFYLFDILSLLFFKSLKLVVIYTAHDLYPHINGKKQIKILNKIYNLINVIVVHGENLKNLFKKIYTNNKSKIVVIPHGFENEMIFFKKDFIVEKIITSSRFNKIYLIFGFQFFNKGTDIVTDLWIKNDELNSKNLLIIAGKIIKYPELNEYTEIKNKNIIFINNFIEEEVLNYYISISNVVLLPYRAASMTGQLSKVVNFKKAVFVTNVGAISEYVNEDIVFLSKPYKNEIEIKLKEVNKYENNTLDEMGKLLFEHFNTHFKWENIIIKYLDLYEIKI